MLPARKDYTTSRYIWSDFYQSSVCPERSLGDSTPGHCPGSTPNSDTWVKSGHIPDQSA